MILTVLIILVVFLCPAVFSKQIHTFQTELNGANLEFQVSITKDSFQLSEPISVEVCVKNISSKTLQFNSEERLWWRIENQKEKNIRQPDRISIHLSLRPLAPGDTLCSRSVLRPWSCDKDWYPIDIHPYRPVFLPGKFEAYFGANTIPIPFNVIIDPNSKNSKRLWKFYEFQENNAIDIRCKFDSAIGIALSFEGDLSKNLPKKDHIEMVYDFVEKNKEMFGLENPRAELKIGKEPSTRWCATVDMKQFYRGVKVMGGGLRAHFYSRENMRSFDGSFHPDIDIVSTPQINSLEAISTALKDLKLPADYASKELQACSACDLELRSGKPTASLIVYPYKKKYYLTWHVVIYLDNSAYGWEYFIGADSGEIVNRAQTVQAVE